MAINNTQAYYWTPEWQEGEKEADKDIREGRVLRFSTAEAMIDELNSHTDNHKEVSE